MKQELPQFNLNEIPESSRLTLFSIIHQEATEYLRQPGIAEKFQKWKAERENRKCTLSTDNDSTGN